MDISRLLAKDIDSFGTDWAYTDLDLEAKADEE